MTNKITANVQHSQNGGIYFTKNCNIFKVNINYCFTKTIFTLSAPAMLRLNSTKLLYSLVA